MEYKIENGAVIPPRNGGRKCSYPFKKCTKVGDNFFVAGKTAEQMSSNCSYWAKRIKAKFTIRKSDEGEEDGVRIWRSE